MAGDYAVSTDMCQGLFIVSDWRRGREPCSRACRAARPARAGAALLLHFVDGVAVLLDFAVGPDPACAAIGRRFRASGWGYHHPSRSIRSESLSIRIAGHLFSESAGGSAKGRRWWNSTLMKRFLIPP